MENGKGAHVTGLINGIGFGSTEFHVLRAHNDNNARFLYHWLQAKPTRQRAIAFMGGSAGQQRVQPDFFRHYRIPKVAPETQRRIAAALDTVDAAIEKTGAVIAKLKQVWTGLLHDLLTRGLDDNGELRDPLQHPEQFKDSPLGRIPKDWRTSRLGAEFPLQRGFDITVANQKDGPVPVVSSSGITSWHDIAIVPGPGVVTGRKGKLGDVYYVDVPYWPHDTSLWVTNFHGHSKRFVALLLQSLRLERFDAATSVPTLNRNTVHPLQIVLPIRGEQDRIVLCTERLDRQIVHEVAMQETLRAIKSGLMSDLLTGRVRVPENIAMGID